MNTQNQNALSMRSKPNAYVESTDHDYLMSRIDHSFSLNDALYGRYLYINGNSHQPFMSTSVPGFDDDMSFRDHFFVLHERHIFSANVINEASFSFNRIGYVQRPDHLNPGLSIALGRIERPIGQINVGGLAPLGHALTLPTLQETNIFQLADNVVAVKGKHTVKAGIDIGHSLMNGSSDFGANGSYTFFSLPDFLAGNVAFFLGTSPSSPGSDRGYGQSDFNFYLQDVFKVRSDFTLNVGLRYEYYSSPSERHGQLANIRNPLTDTSTTVGNIFDPPTNLIAPRVSFAWSPFMKHRTSVRAGVGTFYVPIEEDIYSGTRWLAPFYNLVIGGFGPGTFRNLAVIRPSGFSMPIQFAIQQPYSLSYNFEIQRDLSTNTFLNLAYAGTRGNHLTRSGEANPTRYTTLNGQKFFPDRLGSRLNPNFESVLQIVTDAQSFYNSFQFGIARRLSNGLSFQASYALAKSIDDSSGPLPIDFVSEIGPGQDFFDRKSNRGLSAFDTTHNLVFNFLYKLPFGPGKKYGSGLKGPARRLIEDWELGGILTLDSGMPFTVRQADNRSQNGAIFFADRPNIVPGRHCSITSDPAQWFDPAAFQPPAPGFYGNAGRNVCRGPNFRNMDFTVLKNTRVSDRLELQFRAEVFNLTNHPNFGPPVNTSSPYGAGGNGDAVFAGATPLVSAGRIFHTVSTSRQIQFAIRVLF